MDHSRVLVLLVSWTVWSVAITAAETATEGDIRLAGGSVDHEGTVLIFHAGKWGAICDKGWGKRDAQVACRQLGYPGYIRFFRSSHYGMGRSLVWLSRLRCFGHEQRLDQCRANDWSYHNCYGGRRSAGIKCKWARTASISHQPEPTPLANDTSDEQLPTTRIPLNETSSTIAKANPTTKDGTNTTTGNVDYHRPLGDQASNKVNGTAGEEIDRSSNIREETGTLKFDVQISGGRFPQEGRVEVKLPGSDTWGVICSDEWTIFEARTVCFQLGLYHASAAQKINYYGGETLDKIFHAIKCSANETSLDSCEATKTLDGVSCSKPENVAGVICAKDLPDLVIDLAVLEKSTRLQDHHLYYLQCAMEEKCMADQAYELRKTHHWMTAVRRLLRFSSIVHNRGTADFRPFQHKQAWDWHACHMHYHSMEIFAHYDIIDLQGNRVAQGHKASFCLEDSACASGVTRKYRCIGLNDQGISPNCSDNYLHDIDCQWIDVTELGPGNYTMRVAVNPAYHVAELRYDNNVAVCDIDYDMFRIIVENCSFE